MPLNIMHVGTRVVPSILCDHCRFAIDDAQTGLYQWLDSPEGPVTGQMLFLHKVCVEPFEEANPAPEGQIWGNMELACLPVYLGNSLMINWEDAFDAAEVMG